MLKIALVACLVVIVVAQHNPHGGQHTAHPTHQQPTHTQAVHTDHPHPTHVTQLVHTGTEHGAFKFVYDDATGTLVMTTSTHCYLMDLTDAEKMDVHDRLKMEEIEITMAALVADKTKQTTVDASTLDHIVAGHCRHLTVVRLTH